MENTTDPITQFVNDNVEGEPLFKGYVVEDLKDRVKIKCLELGKNKFLYNC